MSAAGQRDKVQCAIAAPMCIHLQYTYMYVCTYILIGCVCGDTLYTLYCAYVLYYQVLLIVHRYSIVKLWTCRYVLYVRILHKSGFSFGL